MGDYTRDFMDHFAQLMRWELPPDYDRDAWRKEDPAQLCSDAADAACRLEELAKRGPGPHMTPMRTKELRDTAVKLALLAMIITDVCEVIDTPRDGR